jgi:DNA helicase-2/ATP-dependent DNA helicase PcrA
MKQKPLKAELIIAGPGAGKTHNMVEKVIGSLYNLSPARYIAVITYTNSATYNIQTRLAKKIAIPDNLFIGTIHAFLNKFILIPYASTVLDDVGGEKLFLQCQIDDVLSYVKKMKNKAFTVEETASLKSNIKNKLKKKGYITFDQTISIAKECMQNKTVSRIVGNRLQYLFVDEFQDTDRAICDIIENIRKQKMTKIYCVGDPEQYIKSFDSKQRAFTNIPILQIANSNSYEVTYNNDNHRSSETIVKFINQFSKRTFKGIAFQQISQADHVGSPVCFITKYENATHILPDFNKLCNDEGIAVNNRCVVAKKNDVIKKVAGALSQKYVTPKKNQHISLLNTMKETFLSTLQLSQSVFLERYGMNIYGLRGCVLQILKAINKGIITNENTYVKYVTEVLGFTVVKGLPVKIENFKNHADDSLVDGFVTLSNIHTIKGLEAEAVLAIAKTEAELLLWIETDLAVRDAKREDEDTDYPRLGYVAFSRAKKLLCIACLELIGKDAKTKLEQLGVSIL